jgi:hypothetical protein
LCIITLLGNKKVSREEAGEYKNKLNSQKTIDVKHILYYNKQYIIKQGSRDR